MLFDKEFEFKGKHATYCRFLKDEIGLFKTFREVYTMSAIVGFLNKNKGTRDNEKVPPASIFPADLAQKRTQLTFIYRLIMLLEETDGFEINDYKDRTFRYDSEENNEKLSENMEIFNSYVLGGLEILYDKFKDCNDKKDTVNTLNEYLTEFFEDNNLIDLDK